MHQGQGSRTIDISIIIRVIDLRYVLTHTHTFILHTAGARIKDICIIHTCIKIKGHRETSIRDKHYGYGHDGYMYPGCIPPEYMHPTPRIGLSVRPTLKNPASQIHASRSKIMDICIIHTCIIHTCIRIKDHRYMHHTYMHQGQGSRIIDTCNIHICVHHTHMHHDQ